MMANEWDYASYEASDEASETELLDQSLSVWRGLSPYGEGQGFAPTPLDLHTAASLGNCDCVRAWCLRGDEDLNRANQGGWTPLMYACYIGHVNVVNLLLQARVTVNITNKKKQTPLILAASCGNEEVAGALLKAGAELEACDVRGWTALFHATYAGHQNMVRYLLLSGANAEAIEPNQKYTPLMEAAAAGHEIIVQDFLQHGVQVNTKASDNHTARSLAGVHGHIKIVSLIDSFTARPLTSRLPKEKDLSSSDEAYQHPRHHGGARGSKVKGRGQGPSIQDGPQAFAKLINNRGHGEVSPNAAVNEKQGTCIPRGYMMFQPSYGPELRSRDVTSPIKPEDHAESSGGKDSNDYDEESTVFTKTGAVTLKSSSGSSGGLVAALGINEDSIDSGQSSDGRVYSDPGRRAKVGQPTRHGDLFPGMPHMPAGISSATHGSLLSAAPSVATVGTTLSPHAQKEQAEVLANRPADLPALLNQLGLTKYLPIFQEQDVDLPVFLSLTDIDLKEVGIKLFGPRRKMTNAIARWHSNAKPSGNHLEQAYADKLEAEMQEMAVRLHQAYEQMDSLKAQLRQERELRAVTESCLMEDRLAWQRMHHLVSDTRQRCSDVQELLTTMKRYHLELSYRLRTEPAILPAHSDASMLVSAMQEGLSLDEQKYEPTQEFAQLSTHNLIRKLHSLHEDITRVMAISSSNADKILSHDFSAVIQGYS